MSLFISQAPIGYGYRSYRSIKVGLPARNIFLKILRNLIDSQIILLLRKREKHNDDCHQLLVHSSSDVILCQAR